jgi:hypothetical protein
VVRRFGVAPAVAETLITGIVGDHASVGVTNGDDPWGRPRTRLQ